jgi:hypothetical protein
MSKDLTKFLSHAKSNALIALIADCFVLLGNLPDTAGTHQGDDNGRVSMHL